MAEKPIDGNEIVSKGALDEINKGADLLIAKLHLMEQGFKDNLKITQQFLSSTKVDSSAELKAQAQAQKDAAANLLALEKVKEQVAKTEKIRTQALAEAEKVEQQRIKTSQAASKQEAQYNKEIEKSAKSQAAINSEYKKASIELSKLASRQKDNEIAGRGLSKTALLVAQAHSELRDRVVKADAAVGQFQRNVGNYPQQLRQIQRELAALEPGSKQFNELAMRAGILKDKMGDAKDAVKAFANESKSGQAKTLFSQTLDSLKNLDFKDASEKAKQFATVIRSISFAETIAGIKDFGRAIIDVGKAIISTPIGIFLASLTAVIAGVKLYRDTVNFAYEAQSDLNSSLRDSKILIEQNAAAYAKSVNQGLFLQGKLTEVIKKQKDIEIDANLKKAESYNKFLDAVKEVVRDEETNQFQKNTKLRKLYADYAALSYADARKNQQDLRNVRLEADAKERDDAAKKAEEEKKKRDADLKEKIKQFNDNNKTLQQELNKIRVENTLLTEQKEIDSIKLENSQAVERVKNTAANETIKNRLLVELEIKLNQDLLSVKDKYAKERSDAKKKEDEERIAAEKKTDEQILKSGQNNIDAAQQRLDEANTQESKKSADRKKKKEEDLKEAIAFEKQLVDAVAKAEKEKSDLKVAAFDKQISDQDKNIETQRRLAENGAKNTLAEEEANKVKLERQKEQEKQQEIKRQKALAFFKLFASYAEKDPDTALTKALRDTVLAEAVSAAFIEGTENVGQDAQFSGNKFKNGQDGYIARFDGDERILNPEQNKKVGDLSNEALADLAYQSRMGLLDTAKYATIQPTNNFAKNVADSLIIQQNAILINEMRSVKKAIEDKEVAHWDVDKYDQLVKKTIKNGLEKRTIYKKSRIG